MRMRRGWRSDGEGKRASEREEGRGREGGARADVNANCADVHVHVHERRRCEVLDARYNNIEGVQVTVRNKVFDK